MRAGHLYSAGEVLSTQYLLRIGQNQCTLCMTRWYYSLAYKVFYAASIGLSAVLIIYMLLHLEQYPNQWWFLAGETLVTAMMCFDLVFLAVLQGVRNYLRPLGNKVEVGIAGACVLLVLLSFALKGGYQELDEGVGLAVMMLRSLAQYARLLILLKNLRRVEESIIELNEIEEFEALDSPEPSAEGASEGVN